MKKQDLTRRKQSDLDITNDEGTMSAMTIATSDVGTEVRLGVPRPGRPFTSQAAEWSLPVLDAEKLLVEHLTATALQGWLIVPGPLRSGGEAMSSERRASRRLIGAWVTGVVTGQLEAGASMSEAEKWLVGSADCADQLPPSVSREVTERLADVATRAGAFEMLPFVFDPRPHAYRRDLVAGRGGSRARRERKKRGSFYTPLDVVEHIVEEAIGRCPLTAGPFRVLDPACGTGVFLRYAFRRLVESGWDASSALTGLHGVDIDESCVDMAAFVLLADWLVQDRIDESSHLSPVWDDIRSRLVCADSLAVLHGAPLEQVLPNLDSPLTPLGFEDRFSAVVGNPPYARLGNRSDLEQLGERFRTLQGATPGTNMYLAFLELLCSQLDTLGTGSMVVPLSIGYGSNRAQRAIRELAQQVGGSWAFEFYDRTPDALFGDDVKQRTAIVTRRAGHEYGVTTGPVMRWTSRNRDGLFSRVPRVSLGPVPITHGVPKLGSTLQARAYTQLREGHASLQSDLRVIQKATPPFESDPNSVYLAGTAYNWLSVYRDGPAVTKGVDKPSQSGVLQLTFDDATTADAAYAILTSRLVYWLWRVEGDAFHVSASWVRDIPASFGDLGAHRVMKLASLGSQLWRAVSTRPITSVNGGRTTVTFCPYSQQELVDEIDKLVVAGARLPDRFLKELTEFVEELTVAGRDSLDEYGLRRAFASWGDNGE